MQRGEMECCIGQEELVCCVSKRKKKRSQRRAITGSTPSVSYLSWIDCLIEELYVVYLEFIVYLCMAFAH